MNTSGDQKFINVFKGSLKINTRSVFPSLFYLIARSIKSIVKYIFNTDNIPLYKLKKDVYKVVLLILQNQFQSIYRNNNNNFLTTYCRIAVK